MNNVFIMQIVKCFECLKHYILNDSFCESLVETCLKYVSETSSIHVFDKNPETLFEEIPIVVFHNVVMIAY